MYDRVKEKTILGPMDFLFCNCNNEWKRKSSKVFRLKIYEKNLSNRIWLAGIFHLIRINETHSWKKKKIWLPYHSVRLFTVYIQNAWCISKWGELSTSCSILTNFNVKFNLLLLMSAALCWAHKLLDLSVTNDKCAIVWVLVSCHS